MVLLCISSVQLLALPGTSEPWPWVMASGFWGPLISASLKTKSLFSLPAFSLPAWQVPRSCIALGWSCSRRVQLHDFLDQSIHSYCKYYITHQGTSLADISFHLAAKRGRLSCMAEGMVEGGKLDTELNGILHSAFPVQLLLGVILPFRFIQTTQRGTVLLALPYPHSFSSSTLLHHIIGHLNQIFWHSGAGVGGSGMVTSPTPLFACRKLVVCCASPAIVQLNSAI